MKIKFSNHKSIRDEGLTWGLLTVVLIISNLFFHNNGLIAVSIFMTILTVIFWIIYLFHHLHQRRFDFKFNFGQLSFTKGGEVHRIKYGDIVKTTLYSGRKSLTSFTLTLPFSSFYYLKINTPQGEVNISGLAIKDEAVIKKLRVQEQKVVFIALYGIIKDLLSKNYQKAP